MSDTRPGPALEGLLRRLAETPGEFHEPPRQGAAGRIQVAAVIGDLCDRLRLRPPPGALARFAGESTRASPRALQVSLLQAWVLADPVFAGLALSVEPVLALLGDGAEELAEHTAPRKFVADPERREELVRHLLARLGLHPAGETPAQAADRLTSLSAAERARVLAASRRAEARAREVRAALARKAADESADKYTRE